MNFEQFVAKIYMQQQIQKCLQGSCEKRNEIPKVDVCVRGLIKVN
jgi:hypothetical protein